MSFGMILDLLIMACGVYMIYWAVQMRSSNKIPAMLVGKGFPIDRAKDPDGFIRFTFPFTFSTGVVLFALGLVGALGLFYHLSAGGDADADRAGRSDRHLRHDTDEGTEKVSGRDKIRGIV